jgi:hypothetical protein
MVKLDSGFAETCVFRLVCYSVRPAAMKRSQEAPPMQTCIDGV